MTNDFDITSILAFQPPSHICPACRGLFTGFLHNRGVYSCPVCKVEYVVPNWGSDSPSVYKMFGYGGYRITESDMLAHARSLATVLESGKRGDNPWAKPPAPWPTMRLLLETLARAKVFVHFTSWGISHLLIGALKATSMRVPVHGLVSSVEGHARAELMDFPAEAPRLNVRVISSAQGVYDAPHQKVVIVDGLVAFKGSTNLTNAGMRRADRLLDVTEVETNVRKVSELNNRYFAPVWKSLTSPGDVFELDWPPF